MSEDIKHVLPPISTEYERTLASLVDRQLAIPAPIAPLWDVETCPDDLLPWLAWNLSVDVWDPTWPVDVKRAVIRNSAEVHRYKGTRFAVEKVLEPFNVRTLIKEWWEQTPRGQPYTFKITAIATGRLNDNQPLLTPELLQQIISLVRSVKPVSRYCSFEIGVGVTASAGIAAAATAACLMHPSANAAPPLDLWSKVGVATVATAAQVIKRSASADPPIRPAADLGAISTFCAVQIVRTRMPARVSEWRGGFSPTQFSEEFE